MSADGSFQLHDAVLDEGLWPVGRRVRQAVVTRRWVQPAPLLHGPFDEPAR